jgi:hypothetical protein
MLTQEFKDTMNRGLKEKGWDQYDSIIEREVDAYNKRFSTKVDWTLIKAMVWIESGGLHNHAWKTRAMQIGNPGDKAYGVLKHGRENCPLIVSDALAHDIKHHSINEPGLNIRAGIAYLYTRMARFALTTVPDAKDQEVHEYKVIPGDNFERIAHKVGTTVDTLTELNPQALILHPHQTIRYKKAKHRMKIVGWSEFSTQNIADRYNGGGDAVYKDKLDYVRGLLLPGLLRPSLELKRRP